LLALCGVFVVGVIDSTNLALARTQLQSIADGAALAAAQSITPNNATVTGGRLVIALTPATIRSAARQFVRDSAEPGVRVSAVTTPDGRTAIVTLTRVWRAPIDSELLPLRLRLSATARARTVFG
jgi:Flp pilus assembly protein TadG